MLVKGAPALLSHLLLSVPDISFVLTYLLLWIDTYMIPMKTANEYIIWTIYNTDISFLWWRHQMKTFSTLLALCAGNSPVTGEFPSQKPVTRSFMFSLICRPPERLSKQLWSWWFETTSCPLWRHCNGQLWNHKLDYWAGYKPAFKQWNIEENHTMKSKLTQESKRMERRF